MSLTRSRLLVYKFKKLTGCKSPQDCYLSLCYPRGTLRVRIIYTAPGPRNFTPSSILGNVTYFTEQQLILKKGQENQTLWTLTLVKNEIRSNGFGVDLNWYIIHILIYANVFFFFCTFTFLVRRQMVLINNGSHVKE